MSVITFATLADLNIVVTPVAAAGLAAYVATQSGLYVLTGMSQALSFSLPMSSQMSAGQTVTVKRGDASRFGINVVPQGVAQIDTGSVAAIANAFGFLELQWDGSNWWIVGKG